MFQSDLDAFVPSCSSGSATPSSCSSSSIPSYTDTQTRNAIPNPNPNPSSNKRNSSEIFTNSVKAGNTQFEGGFCMGVRDSCLLCNPSLSDHLLIFFFPLFLGTGLKTGGTSGIQEERRCHRSKIRSRNSGKGRKQ